MLDKKLETLGVKYQRQYDLLKGVINSDKKKSSKILKDDITDKELMEILVSKTIEVVLR